MKTLVMAAVAALSFSTAASAADWDTNTVMTTVETGALSFSATTTVDSDLDGFGNDYVFGVEATAIEAETGDILITGATGETAGDTYAVVGVELVNTVVVSDSTALDLGVAADYVMFDNFDNGEVFVTPNAELTIAVTDTVAVFGAVDYTVNASDEFARLGGTVEVGADFAVMEGVVVTPSVTRPFDADNTDYSAGLEVTFSF